MTGTPSLGLLQDLFAARSIARGGFESYSEARILVARWYVEEIRKAKHDAFNEGFNAGWAEAKDPDAFVNDVWDAKTPNPYTEGP